jgi:hypothetical protein
LAGSDAAADGAATEEGGMLESRGAGNNISYFGDESVPIPQANKPDF